jgi:hypothetical protein
MPLLHEILAIEKGTKTRVARALTDLHKSSQKSDLYNGFTKTYEPLSEDGVQYPPEQKQVQLVANTVVGEAAATLAELMNIQATKDFGNTTAAASVVVEHNVVLENAPTTLLLFLEKQFTDFRTFVSKLPVLETSEVWTNDPNSDYMRAEPRKTHKTQKIQKPIVLYDATDKHPAQTQLITEDQIVGYWTTRKFSGAIATPARTRILRRIDTLLDAIKQARAIANARTIEKTDIAERLFSYILS